MSDVKNKIVDDVTRVLSGMSGAASALRDEMDHVVSAKIDQMMSARGLVTRDEFEVLREQVAHLQAKLAERE